MERRIRPGRAARQDGAISIMAAVLVAAMVMATSLAVDVGRVAFTSRDQQGVTDRAVLDALRHLGDQLPVGATAEQVHAIVVASVAETLTGNTEGSSVGTARDRQASVIEVGYTDASCVYDPAAPQPEDPQDFCVVYSQDGAGPYYGDYDPTPGVGESITTVRVVTQSAVDFVFAFLDEDGKRDVVKQALGTNRREWAHPEDPDAPPPPPPCVTPSPPCPVPPPDDSLVDAEAGISVRSRLVELDTGDAALDLSSRRIVQRLVGGLLGLPDPTAQLTLVGWDGLATASVPLSTLGDAGATVGTVDQLLDSQVTLANLFTAMAAGATSDDAAVTLAAQTALGELASQVDPALTVRVGDFLVATTEDPTALLTAEVDALTMVMHATLTGALANGTNVVDLDMDLADLGGLDVLGLPGLLSVGATLQVLEAPQLAWGPVRHDTSTGRYETVARTAQVDLDLDLEMAPDAVESLLGPDVTSALAGLLCLLPLTCPPQDVTVDVAVAEADAQLAGIACHDPTAESDLTTILTSDALSADIEADTRTLVDSHDATNSVVLIPEVPGEGSASVANASLTNIPVLDRQLSRVLGLLGISTGTAHVASTGIDCDVPVLMANTLAP